MKLQSYRHLSSPIHPWRTHLEFLPRRVAVSAWMKKRKCLKPVNKSARWGAIQLVNHVLMPSTERMLIASNFAKAGEYSLGQFMPQRNPVNVHAERHLNRKHN
mmetsp:Transcript_25697/g.50066  ORF Transcript_25697/g.50066 Transcript_25697/m.50066 type:complete len:103 (+) Transcript_25697:486-794(+)